MTPETDLPAQASRNCGGNRINALVLTFDRNRAFTSHMVTLYRKLWPSHPFRFLVPFQESGGLDNEEIFFLTSPPEIRDTVLRLLESFRDDDWIYWCIDDKYPLWMDTNRIGRLAKAIQTNSACDIDGVSFCREPNGFDPARLGGRTSLAGEALVERMDYYGIWIHQFARAKVVRHLFESFPTQIARAKDMDPLKDNLAKPAGHRLYATTSNLALFGESMSRGRVTKNCRESCAKLGVEIPRDILELGAAEQKYLGGFPKDGAFKLYSQAR
jgi:hypothetical protein